MKTKNKKTLLIVGGVVLAVGAVFLVRRKSAGSSSEPAVAAPATYFSPGQENLGNLGNLSGGGGGTSALGSVESTGGGAPATPVTGVTTTPELEHNWVEHCVGVSAIAGKPGGIKCFKVPTTTPVQTEKQKLPLLGI